MTAAVASTLAVCLTTTLDGQAVPRHPRRGVGASVVAVAMVRIPAGAYRPLYNLPESPRQRAAASASKRTTTRRRVAAFDMDVFPVTNGEYLAFVREHPEWRRSRANRYRLSAPLGRRSRAWGQGA
jgi:formylglycine-generating enzyme required for sulfatase activity